MGKDVWKEREIGSRENGFGVSVDCRSIWQMSIVPRGVRRCVRLAFPCPTTRCDLKKRATGARSAMPNSCRWKKEGRVAGPGVPPASTETIERTASPFVCEVPFIGPPTSYFRSLTAPDFIGEAARACGPSLSLPQRTLAKREEERRRWSLESPSALVNRRRRLDSIRHNP
jgi:hypothetical protein